MCTFKSYFFRPYKVRKGKKLGFKKSDQFSELFLIYCYGISVTTKHFPLMSHHFVLSWNTYRIASDILMKMTFTSYQKVISISFPSFFVVLLFLFSTCHFFS